MMLWLAKFDATGNGQVVHTSHPTMPPASTQLLESIASIVDSQEHLIDKARRFQDKCIKANQNFFVTWDQWVPPKLWPTPSPQRVTCQLTKSKQSLMPSCKKTTKELAKEHFGHEKFDMCWGTEADKALTVETPNVGPSAKPHFGVKTFDMCWDAEVDPVLIIAASTAEPQPAIQYDLCWDDAPMEETPSASAVGYKANSDMCWGDLPLGTDGDHDGVLTQHGLLSQIVEGSKELLH
ncbi:uncharacterized protein BJ212DRAFT_1300679 [Suillus subaureus]|uniref:Uncharacterized protein n=1 Tax=Suillus subaureus TaxID=48587 RepID=A0A9P7JCJ0_9AGAM|nr:uncharacterized protein BJ212DRAFT_1300679 [Suillus subaureus]KAG1814385.1 hypothetical protein BJ212DRAFT_1300679 [Suillus subaureus]